MLDDKYADFYGCKTLMQDLESDNRINDRYPVIRTSLDTNMVMVVKYCKF